MARLGRACIQQVIRAGTELNREIDPGRVFDQALPLGEVAEAYRAMDERRAIKTLLWT